MHKYMSLSLELLGQDLIVWLEVSRHNGGYFGSGHHSARGPIRRHHLLIDLHIDGPLVIVSCEALASVGKLLKMLLGNVMLGRTSIFLVHHCGVSMVCGCLDRIFPLLKLVLIVGLEEATDAVAFIETGCIDLDHVMDPICLCRYLGCDAHALGRYLGLIVCTRAYH